MLFYHRISLAKEDKNYHASSLSVFNILLKCLKWVKTKEEEEVMDRPTYF